MPTFGLRGATVAKYHNNSGVVSYDAPIQAGCAINVQLELKFAEARLYACDTLAEYLKEAIGGTITFGAKYFPDAAQQAMFGATLKTRQITYTNASGTEVTEEVSSLVTAADDEPSYVGFAAYAPDMIDGVKKFTAFCVAKAKFSPPSHTLATKSDSITFQTPSTTGEFMSDDSSGMVIQEFAVCNNELQAKAWCAAVFPAANAQSSTPAQTGGEGQQSGGEGQQSGGTGG